MCNRLDWRRWTWKTASVAILLLLIVVTNPELRAYLLLVNGVGLELMIFLIVLQLRFLIPSSGMLTMRAGTWLCLAVYAACRGATRTLALLALLARSATTGMSAFLLVLSHNLWCPLRNSAVSK
jgi:hypothetical protein